MKKRIFSSQTLAEVLIAMLVVSIVIVAAMTGMTRKKSDKNWDENSIICIKNELVSNISSSACSASILGCKFDRNNAYNTIRFYADHNGNATIQEAAKKVFANVCDQGGEKACEYFITSCQKYNASCDNSTSNYDIQYYLNMPTSNTTTGRFLIEDLAKPYYDIGYTNVKNIVDNTCCQGGSAGNNTACVINGENCTASAGSCDGGTMLGSLCIANTDESDIYTFNSAVTQCAARGTGWRIPTLAELRIIYNNRSSLGTFSTEGHWSATQVTIGGNPCAYIKYFDDGYEEPMIFFLPGPVRCIK